MPVIVDLRARLETQQQLVVVDFILRRALVTLARVGIAGLTVPFYLVRIALEVRDADAEAVELIVELRGQLVDRGLVRRAHVATVFLGHGLGDHLCHLVARDVLVTLEGAVAIALDYAILGELGNGIVCPMALRHIRKRIARSERRAGSANNQSSGQCRNNSLFHDNLLLAPLGASSFYPF